MERFDSDKSSSVFLETCVQEKELQFTVFGVSITNSKIKGFLPAASMCDAHIGFASMAGQGTVSVVRTVRILRSWNPKPSSLTPSLPNPNFTGTQNHAFCWLPTLSI